MNFNFCDRGARKVGRRRATKCGCLAFQNSSPQLAVHIYVQFSCDSVDKRIGKASENGLSLSSCIIPTPREHTAAAFIGGRLSARCRRLPRLRGELTLFRLRVKAGREAEYVERHRHVWPAVLADLEQTQELHRVLL